MAKVVKAFFDAQNNKYLYRIGDEYPRKGKPKKARLDYLIKGGFVEKEEINEKEISE